MGLNLAFADDAGVALLQYMCINALACSIVPLPLAAPLVAVGALRFGFWLGMLSSTVSQTAGAYILLLFTRIYCGPQFERLLGRHVQRWQKIDSALVADGPMLALLLRLSPLCVSSRV